MPSDAELERDVREALRVANMDEMSLKVIRKQLEVKWQVNSKCQRTCSPPVVLFPAVKSVQQQQYHAIQNCVLVQQCSLWVQDTYQEN